MAELRESKRTKGRPTQHHERQLRVRAPPQRMMRNGPSLRCRRVGGVASSADEANNTADVSFGAESATTQQHSRSPAHSSTSLMPDCIAPARSETMVGCLLDRQIVK